MSPSATADDVQVLLLSYDYSYVICDEVEELVDRHTSLEVCVDSRTLFNVKAKDSQTAERRLQVYILALKERCSRFKIPKMVYIPGRDSTADASMKKLTTRRSPLWK